MPKQLTVMVSSTSRDLPEHRAQVRDACLQQGMFPIMMEHLPADDAEAIPASLAMVNKADIYLLILAQRYGYVPKSGNPSAISVTEHEYNRAVERKIPCLTFAMHEDHPLKAGDVEKGEGSVKLEAFKARALLKGANFFRSSDDLRAQVLHSLTKFVTFQPTTGPEPLIHSLPTQQEIEGREAECQAILQAMSAGDHQVYAFTAPGGFGKTALLAKVVKTLAPDDATLLGTIKLPGETIEPHVSAFLHVDCRKEVKLGDLFTNAGRLVGEQQSFEAIYNSDAELLNKLQQLLQRLSAHEQDRAWFIFDNFESMLTDTGEVADPNLRAFFSAIFAGGHRVRALIAAREVPKFSARERVEVLEAVGDELFDGLPIDDCVEFLKKNGGLRGLTGTIEETEAVLKEFANRVHRIPLALVWAAGYLEQTNYTLKEILNRADLFADFDKEQGKEADRYENKGLKRLHYEQLKIQPAEFLPVLQLLAFFKRPVPRGVIAHLMDEIELSKTLTRLERNRLITHKESPDAHTRFLGDPLAVNLYGLHPVICENPFFDTLPDQEKLLETAADVCWTAASAAFRVNRHAYVLEVADCAEKLYEHLIKAFNRNDLLYSNGAMLNEKGLALSQLTKLNEALKEYDNAIEIYEQLVNEDQQTHLAANALAAAYMNKGIVLWQLTQLNKALAEYDKAIEIYERVNREQQTHLADDLARAYMNKGIVLRHLTKLNEALVEYDKAIAIYERLVNEEPQTHDDLALAYINKGNALCDLPKLNEALVEYNKAIEIYERLVDEAQQTHLAYSLGNAYMNKGVALRRLTKFAEALAQYDNGISIYERLVDGEQQTHRANDLATAYSNKALTLEEQGDLEAAIDCYEKSVSKRMLCVDHLNMYWIVPDLLNSLRLRVRALFKLERWQAAASDVKEYFSRFDIYLANDSVDASLKEAAQNDVASMVSTVRGLTPEQRELLYAELGDDADALKSLVDAG